MALVLPLVPRAARRAGGASVRQCFSSAPSSAAAGSPRVAVAGAGWWSQGWHIPQLARNPDAELAAIVEPSQSIRSSLSPGILQVGELGEKYGVPVFDTVDDLLASEAASGLDGLVVCTSHAAHYEVGRKALEAGLHVLMEKPMTTDGHEARALEEAASRSGRHFMVNNTANWRPNSRRAAGLVADGRIGEVQHVNCYMGSPLLWLFDDPANEGWVRPSGAMTGNGFGWGQLSHTLAWVYRVTGLQPKSVFAFMGWSKNSGADLYDSGTVLCTNGATISVQGVAALPGANPVASKQIDNKVFGSEGFLMYSGDDQDAASGDLVLRRHDGDEERHAGFLFENYEAEGLGPESLLAFLDACRGASDVWNGCDASVGAKTAITIEAMYKSATTGQRVDVA